MTVHSFPLHRQQGVLEEVVEGLKCRQHDDANQFWRSRAKTLLKELMERGVPRPTAEGEVRALLYAALEEMQRARCEGIVRGA